ncbi:MAG TPA: HAD family hydrolase [Thermoplasmata archaeon]|nr:HAD family hydrolase [Thermoplasmata archaeon]
MPDGRRRAEAPSPELPPDPDPEPAFEPAPLNVLRMVNPESLGAGNEPALRREEAEVPPRQVERGVIAFDLDGTLLDDIKLISHVAADVLHQAFGTPPEEGRIHYLATTGMPFEAQLAQLYPDAPPELRRSTARTFHERKAREAYAYAHPYPEIPRILKQLDRERWTMVISTGAEREVADLMLEREGLRIWFDAVLGSAQGTKREHLLEFRRRYSGAPMFLVGDSRFDLEAARDTGVPMLGRASLLPGWTLTPEDFRSWGAIWSDYNLSAMPEVVAQWKGPPSRRSAPARSKRPRSATPSGRSPGPAPKKR